MNLDISSARWLNRPRSFEFSPQSVKIITDPHTDFWQRTYYGFRNDNGHALLWESEASFTLTARATFHYRGRFDQCGLILYLDQDHWFKTSVEYETETLSRLGSVVTHFGYSDWATTDIPTPTEMWYRLSRRGPDFLIEASADGVEFRQMRIFHLHPLGETTPEMGKSHPPASAERPVSFGLYACSPLHSSFEACFDHLLLEECQWQAHE